VEALTAALDEDAALVEYVVTARAVVALVVTSIGTTWIDLGHRDEAGYLVITGRKKELILVGGSNVLPGEVERVLGETPGVDEVAVTGLPDPDRGEVVAAFVVARADADPAALERALRAHAKADLAAYKRPRSYRFVAALPRNAMGKIDRRRLREG